jgi:hypothetical protein
MRRLAVAVVLVLVLATTAAGSTHGPPSGLSDGGRALWNFEALLHDTFGDRDVCTAGSLNFVSNGCSPLSTYSPYFYVFAGAHDSAFHLAKAPPRGSFGNYPVLLRINGRFIACGPRERTFLVEYGNSVNFAVDCIPPLR